MALIPHVKEVRERTGAGMNDCRVALDESGGDIDRAIEILQKKGILRAAALSVKDANEGLVHSYIHHGKIGVLLEVNCMTDFVARSDEFRQFCEDIAMQIAAMGALYLSADLVPKDVTDKQVEIITEQLRHEKKPEKLWATIAAGRLSRWYGEVCLAGQESFIHPGKTIEQLRAELVAKVGENIQIKRFTRYELGDGISKPKVSFSDEVSKLVNQ